MLILKASTRSPWQKLRLTGPLWLVLLDILLARASHRQNRMKPRATMLELSRKQRDLLADNLPDFANIAAGGWLFGQFAGGQDFSGKVAAAGVIVWIMVMVLSLVLSRGSE